MQMIYLVKNVCYKLRRSIYTHFRLQSAREEYWDWKHFSKSKRVKCLLPTFTFHWEVRQLATKRSLRVIYFTKCSRSFVTWLWLSFTRENL